jgi:hypothetical protein
LKITRTKISGSWQRLVFSCWISAALFLIGYNGSKLMTLLSPPIAGRSMEVRLASQKWRQLQNKISRGSEAFKEVIDLDRALLGTSSAADNTIPKLSDISSDENKKAQQTEIQLPILSGILRNTDIHGRAYATAIIAGHRLKENDRIQGFTIQKILENGVVVTRSGRQWFLSAPNVSYSRVHVAGAKGNVSQ